MNSEPLRIGSLIESEQQRDAIHVAVVPVTAAETLAPGAHVRYADGKVYEVSDGSIGVIDPFLRELVKPGQRCWLFLHPGSITSIRHEWSHPAFATVPERDAHKEWMTAWAREHMGEDYYGDAGTFSDDVALENAIGAGHRLNVGPYESARDHIDSEWWTHWEAITGCKGQRGEYFSCVC